jgi:hypothetical protein
MSREWFKIIAIASVAGNLLLGLGVLWAINAYGSNLDVISSAGAICYPSGKSFDSIAAAQMIGRLDQVSFLMTMGGIFLAFFALGGFWMIRREAIDEACKVAAEAARETAQKYYAGENKNGTNGGDNKDKKPYTSSAQLKTRDPNTVSTAGASEAKEGA